MKRLSWQVVVFWAVVCVLVSVVLWERPGRSTTPQDTVVMVVEFDPNGQWVSQGSAFWIDNKTLLTAGHVAKLHDPANILKVFSRTDVFFVEESRAMIGHDLGIIRIEGTYTGPVAHLGSAKNLRVGDHVMTCGYMLTLGEMGLDLTTTWGRVSDVCLPGKNAGDVLLDITIYPGGSGGPIWCNGKVVGVVSRGIPGLLIVEPVDFK